MHAVGRGVGLAPLLLYRQKQVSQCQTVALAISYRCLFVDFLSLKKLLLEKYNPLNVTCMLFYRFWRHKTIQRLLSIGKSHSVMDHYFVCDIILCETLTLVSSVYTKLHFMQFVFIYDCMTSPILIKLWTYVKGMLKFILSWKSPFFNLFYVLPLFSWVD